MTELTEAQRERRRKQAHTAITNALTTSWPEWRRTGRRPDFTTAADYALDGLGDLAAEILADGTMMRGLNIQDGAVTLELEPATEILKLFVASMRGVLDGHGAENYVEMDMQAPSVSMDLRDGDNPMDSYTVTIQRRTRPTPHEFRQRAEARVTELEQELRELRGETDTQGITLSYLSGGGSYTRAGPTSPATSTTPTDPAAARRTAPTTDAPTSPPCTASARRQLAANWTATPTTPSRR